MDGKQERESVMSSFTLRRLGLRDGEALVRLEALCFPSPWTRELVLSELAKQSTFSFGITVEGELVGYAVGRLIAGELHLLTLGVHPRFRRRSVGFLLLSGILREAEAVGAELATLEVRVSNYAAQSLYRKVGFSLVGLRRNYYSNNGEDAYLLSAVLKPCALGLLPDGVLKRPLEFEGFEEGEFHPGRG